ncbi:MAG: sigma 54-dependent Fis family transcriptional regulator [Myxococcales bacterium]|nr:sigma 54-dependent Fis family transcriptional regulator [Myxococcales bacterium]
MGDGARYVRAMAHATRTLTSAMPERFTLPKYKLRVLDGPGAGTERICDRRLVYVGSAPDNDLVLEDAAASRCHLKIEGERQGYRVRDLSSKNGTWLAGSRLVEAVLTGDTTLRIGQTRVAFELLSEVHEVALSLEPRFGALIGASREMREIFALLARVAGADVTVLVQGESGTGKELVAEALHSHSTRANGPLVVFDCSAVQPNLMESELFGHVRGAFTGAVAARQGAMVEADGGTLFLDEIGELSLELQPKLLRALEKHEVRQVGSNERKRVDVRVVAATNRDLAAMVSEGTFRQDLFYRLNVIRVVLPPLRRRPEDVPILVQHFLEEAQARSQDKRQMTVSFETMQQLQAHAWPGNVRELRNYVTRATVLSSGAELEMRLDTQPVTDQGSGAGVDVRYDLPFKDAKARLIDVFERTYWTRALEAHGWNISATARATGLHRKSLEYVIKKLDLKRPAKS